MNLVIPAIARIPAGLSVLAVLAVFALFVSPTPVNAANYGTTANSYGYNYGSTANSYDYNYGSTANSYDYNYGSTANSYDYDYGSTANWYDYSYGSVADSYDYDYGSTANSYDYNYGSTANGYDYNYGSVADGYNYYDSYCSTCYDSVDYYSYYVPNYTSNYESYPIYSSYPTYVSTPSYSYSTPIRVTNPVYSSYTTPAQYTTTNNTCTGNSCNTSYVDNSINGSFNTDNSINNSFNGNTTIAEVIPVSATPVQYPVQYTYPQQNLSCTITASPNSVASGQSTTLSWSTYGSVYGATTAWLSDGLGNVAPNGSRTVNPTVSKNYTLTVSGYGGTQTCTTYVSVVGNYYPYYNPPVQTGYPYVALTQIPYTGFDFGTYGNALYWAGLLCFALAGAYLVIYYLPTPSLRQGKKVSARASSAPLSTPAIFGKNLEGKKVVSPSLNRSAPIEHLPVAPSLAAPRDSMALIRSKHGEAPRIVITRA